ncbi:hypothetical protein Tco_1330956 [Tanacetum coccineum]
MVLENNKNIDDAAQNVIMKKDAAAYENVAPDIILILSDDDEDEEDAAASHPGIIVIPSDDEVDEKEVKTPTNSDTITSSRTIDVHVDVEQLARATTTKLDRIWVDLVRKEIRSLLDIIDDAEHRIETDTNAVDGLMKLVLQNMKDTTNWMEQLKPYFTQ